ncbi:MULTISPECIES: PA2169 family four-helix-bundle protein [Pseudomonas]|uniref:PA2169 family four-helix-bundle protein n=2 Tax=Pseudomonas TaxID=286 RepID=A0ABY6FIC6_9PSED|nr:MULTISPECIES: PA2169 family four-helix-bundle protein [Pseudomonas]MCQ2992571.1 PA2169 family four-helix-bundle protein [Pseudomonas syringae]MBC3951822.1 PA2169 family four-helix-bundle protein [Pseudomonas folii]MCD5969637.1 PA2169 family four-helix-bundle protein [Pseudomonas quasicaspiana]MCD5976994.1 PA2169 family four-helix-bundle protein [Pseudomonas quasicaspiana]MCQ3029175.1 PA2169 family four-helix-bundle protein [Pseudomonas syringae]
MTDINKESISLLNDLIETSKDGEKGFQTSAEDIKNPAIKAYFLSRSAEIKTSVAELQAEVRSLGGDPETSSSVSGTLHRAWVDLKSVLTGKDDKAILEEVERGEDVALKAYKEARQKAVEKNLPASVTSLIDKQLVGVQANHDKVRDLRNAARAEKAAH